MNLYDKVAIGKSSCFSGKKLTDFFCLITDKCLVMTKRLPD
jgi:hypothetical protein